MKKKKTQNIGKENDQEYGERMVMEGFSKMIFEVRCW
jgi:hypothetical protein